MATPPLTAIRDRRANGHFVTASAGGAAPTAAPSGSATGRHSYPLVTAADGVPASAPLADCAGVDVSEDDRSARRAGRARRVRDPYYDRVADMSTVVVAVTAGVASWAGLVLLGEHAGMGAVGPVRIAWLIALCIDVVALIALRAWINTRASGEYRRWGRGISVAALSVSIAGNALGHVLDDSDRWLLTATVAAIPPLALFAALHLRVLRTQSRREAVERAQEREQRRQRTRPTSRTRTGHTPSPDRASDRPASRTSGRTIDRTAERVSTSAGTDVPNNGTDGPVDTEADRAADAASGTADRVAALAASRPDMTTTEMAAELGVTARTVRRHMAALKTDTAATRTHPDVRAQS